MVTTKKSNVLIDQLLKRFKDAILETHVRQDEICHVVDKKTLGPICEYLIKNDDIQMNYLVDIVGVDHLTSSPRFEVVYHLYSIPKRHRLRLKVKVDSHERLPSLTGLWPSANWPEREVFDMYGIEFDEHPEMARIYMAENWKGFPLRKDYPLRGYKDEYNPFGEEMEEDF